MGAPIEQFKGDSSQITKGGWRAENLKVISPKTTITWSAVELCWQSENPHEDLTDFVKELRTHMKDHQHMDVAEPALDYISAEKGKVQAISLPDGDVNENFGTWSKLIDSVVKAAKTKNLTFLLIALPTKSQKIYEIIRSLSDVKHGVHIICTTTEQIQKLKGPAANEGATQLGVTLKVSLALRVNLKSGGTNQTLNLLQMESISPTKTLIMGIYTLQSTEEKKPVGMPSIATVVANVDASCSQWPASIHIQTEGVNSPLITDLAPLVRERLDAWRKANNDECPKHVIVYRHGVCGNALQDLKDIEIAAIKSVLDEANSTNPPDSPALTVVLASKSCQTRFTPVDGAGRAEVSKDKKFQSQNPRNGIMIVEKAGPEPGSGLEPGESFYLQPQHAANGTAHVVKYRTIVNENCYSRDELGSIVSQP